MRRKGHRMEFVSVCVHELAERVCMCVFVLYVSAGAGQCALCLQ